VTIILVSNQIIVKHLDIITQLYIIRHLHLQHLQRIWVDLLIALCEIGHVLLLRKVGRLVMNLDGLKGATSGLAKTHSRPDNNILMMY